MGTPLTREELARLEAAVAAIATIAQTVGQFFVQMAPVLAGALTEIESIGKRL